MKPSFVFLAQGFEEVEALTTVDVLRRASIDVKTVSITSDKAVTGAHGITVMADACFDDVDLTDAEWLICPGGLPGATNLHEFGPLSDALKAQNEKDGHIAAICAAPAVVLAPLGILKGKQATCYPGFEEALTTNGAEAIDATAVVYENIITADGPASAMTFALAIINVTLGAETEDTIATGLLY